MKSWLLLLISFLSYYQHSAQIDLLMNPDIRSTYSLNGNWNYIVDPYETGYYDYRYEPYDAKEETKTNRSAYYNNAKQKDKKDRVEYNFDDSPTLLVPGDWNSQDEKLLYYEGTIWYKKSFNYVKTTNDNRVFIYFGAVNYIAEVYLNGEKLGVHEGGFTPFNFEVTDFLKQNDNYLVVKVENTRKKDRVPTINTDWWNYGGITRDVLIVETPKVFVKDYSIQLKKGTKNEIVAKVHLSDQISGQNIEISIPELNIKGSTRTTVNGQVEIELKSPKIDLWSPNYPKLYQINISTKYETLTEEIGFRSIEVSGEDILLNGEPIFLRGICMHEENGKKGGRAFSESDALIALNWAKEMNCNYMRLAHYPHNSKIVKKADEYGIMLWSEVPVYWTVDFNSEEVYKKAEQQLKDMIARDKNRASIIIWSMSNETPQSEARNIFLTRMITKAKELDSSRLISAALQHRTDDKGINLIDDPISSKVDIIGFNQYIGWYGGDVNKVSEVKWLFDQNKPVIISEFGAGALAGYYGDSETIWTEDYQAHLYQQTINMMKNMSSLRGVTPWILVDFRSPKRNLPRIQDGWNRKGLISNNGKKKKAFFVMQKWYNELELKKINNAER